MTTKKKENEVVTRVGKFTKLENDIGIISYNGNIDITAFEMKNFLEEIYLVMNGKRFYLINEVKEIGVFTNEVWAFLGTNILHNNTIIASAITSDSLGYKLQTSFNFKKYPLKYPVRLFKNKELAKKWVAELKMSQNENKINPIGVKEE